MTYERFEKRAAAFNNELLRKLPANHLLRLVMRKSQI
jgi:hypothetical protein